MGMKPRLDDGTKKFHLDPKLVTCINYADGSETDANIPGTVTRHKPEENKKITPNVVSGPKQHNE